MNPSQPPSRSPRGPRSSSRRGDSHAATWLWAAVVSTLAVCATVLAIEVALILEELAAPPVVIETRAPTLPAPRKPPIARLDQRFPACGNEQESRLQQLEDQAQELRLRNRQLRRLLERQAQAAHYRQKAPSARPPAVPHQPARRRRPLLQTSVPAVALIGSDALVTATVRNLSDLDLRPRIEVELLRNGRRIRRRSFSLHVPAGATAPFAETFPTSLADGTYSATVVVDP